MRKIILSCVSFFVMALLISGSPAKAQGTVWVSATGSGNNCTFVSPCGNFATALAISIQTSASRISCINGGNYVPFTITSSIIIDCDGGAIAAIGGANAITVQNSGITVILRHLGLDGNGTAGTAGIYATNFSGTLIVEDCTIQGFSQGYGINFVPSSGRGLLQVSNSQILNNATGIAIAPTGGQIASATLNAHDHNATTLTHELY